MDEVGRSLQRLLPPQYVSKLLATRGSVAGERRVVTILFSDVKGSTAMAEHLDPEEVLEIMNGAFKVLIEPITRYEGTLARLMGDAILAFFGAPIAHEDDPDRACYAALDIIAGAQQYAARLERERGVKGFNVRVGLNTGLVVVAEVGSDLRVEYTAMGDAVNLASRMETAAEPGTVLLSEATLDHIAPTFDVESMGTLKVKGKTEPVPAYRLLRPKMVRAGIDRFHGAHAIQIGRGAELQALRARLCELAGGRGSIVSIRGDIGVGKSRLVQEIRVEMRSCTWAETRSSPHSEGMSYQTLREFLLNLVANRLGPGTAAEIAGPQPSGAETPPLGMPGPYLSMILRAPGGIQKPEQQEEYHAEEILPHVIQELHLLLWNESAVRPLVLVWDDLQWIDPSSLTVLEAILPLVEEVPVLFLLLFREQGDRMALFSQRVSRAFPERSSVITLTPLDHDNATLLLDTLLSGRNVPRDVRDLMIERTDGNPLFLEEIVRQLSHAGRQVPGAMVHGSNDAAGAVKLPDTLRGVIMARVDRLAPAERRILQTASVLGRNFQMGLLRDILPQSVGDSDMAQSLKELVRREFIQPLPDEIPGNDALQHYAFTHSLTYEVVHESMLLAQRKELHGRAARAIRQSFVGDSAALAEKLAVHYEIAGEQDEAFQCLMEAAEHAKSVYAHLEAINYYRRALKLAVDMGIGGAMLRILHEGLGDVLTIAAKYPAAIEQFDNALALSQSVRRQATLHRKKGLVYERSGLCDDAEESFKKALAVLHGTPDLAETAQIYCGLSRVQYLRGCYQSAIELAGLAMEILQKREDHWSIAQARNTLGLAYTRTGEDAKALEQFRQALSIWEQRKDSYGLSATLNNLGQLAHQRGDYSAAIVKFQQSITLCKQTGNRHGLAAAYDNLGQSLALSGQPEEGTMYLAKAVAILSDIGSENAELVPELWQRSGVW